MAIFKVIMELNSFRGGWSEGFFWEDVADIDQAYNNTLAIINARMNCSPQTVSLVGIRISFWTPAGAPTPSPRASQFFESTLQGQLVSPVNQPPDLLQAKATLTCISNTNRRRLFWIGGMSDFQTTFLAPGGQSIPGAALGGALTLLIGLITNSRFRMRAIALAAPPYDWKDITALQGMGTAGPQVTFTTLQPHGLAQGDYVNFGRANKKLLPGLTGYFQVLSALTINTFTIGYYSNYAANPPFVLPAGMRARKVSLGYNPVNSCRFNSFRGHKVGKSLGESRGRSRGVSFRR